MTSMQRTKQITKLAVLIGLEFWTLAWLLQLDNRAWLRIEWSNLGRWLRVTPTEDAVVAIVWTAAVVCTIWLATSTLLYVAARALRVPALIRSVGWMTLPAIRKVSEGALAAILVTSAVAPLPVRAEVPSSVVVVVDEDGGLLPPGFVGSGREILDEVRPPADSQIPPLPSFPILSKPVEIETQTAVVTVQAGDNLWTMSRQHLTGVFDWRPSNQEIAPYWRQVIALNQPKLVSGDPDLIYTGEVIEMPPTN